MFSCYRPLLALVFVLFVLAACQPITAPPEGAAMPVMETMAPEILARGAPIRSPNGIKFGPNGNLYVASINERAILVMDPETGAIITRVGPEAGVEGPDDLAFGPDGSLYWTAFLKGEVGRLSPAGAMAGQMVAPGVNPIAFTEDGRLLVGLAFLGDALYELDPALAEPPRLLAENLGGLNSFQVGAGGFLYAPIMTKGQVVRIGTNTQPPQVEVIAEGLNWPTAVKLDSQGNVYANSGLPPLQEAIIRVDTQTGEQQTVITLTYGIDSFTFSADDRLFISHIADGAIYEALPNGSLRTVSPPGMVLPGGIAVLPRPDGESVFVADFYTLREFDGSSGEVRSVTRNDGRPDYLTLPFTASADGEHLVLTSFIENKVQIWDPGQGEEVAAYLDFQVPVNALRFRGDLVVAELGTGSVVRANPADLANRVTLIEELGAPAGLAASDDGLWVSDYATGNVWQLIAGGETLMEPKQIASGLAGPEGMAVTPDGHLLVVETGAGRLLSLDLATGAMTTLAAGLGFTPQSPGGGPPTWVMSSVAVGPTGTIYVTGDEANVVYRIRPGR